MKILGLYSKEIQKLYDRYYCNKKRVTKKVQGIVHDVREEGDKAVLRYTRRFDRVKLSPREIKVSANEINAAFQNIDTDFISDLKRSLQISRNFTGGNCLSSGR